VTSTTPTSERADWKRRLFVAWVVASLLWLGGWLAYIRWTCGAEAPDEPELCYTNLFSDAMSSRFTIADYASIALSGLAIPVAVLVVGAAIWWAVNRDRA